MKNWKKVVGWVLAAAVVVGVVGFNAYKSQERATTGKQKVYAVLPLTGNVAFVGQKIQKSIEFIMQKENYPFEVVFVDSESNPTKGLTALQSAAVPQDKPIALSFMSSVSSVILPYIDQKNGFLFTISTKSVTADSDSFLHMDCPLSDIINPLVRHVAQSYRRIDIVYLMEDYGLAEKNFLVSELKKNGFNNIQEWSIPFNVSDPKNEVTKLLSTNPEAVIILGNPTLGYINLFKALHLQDFKGDVLAAELADPTLLEMLQSHAEGTIAVVPVLNTDEQLSDGERKLKQEIDAIGIKTNYNIPTQTWDALNLIKYTIENKLPFDRKTYENLKDWKNVAGNINSFNKEQNKGCSLRLTRYQNGVFHLMKENTELNKNGQFVLVESEEK